MKLKDWLKVKGITGKEFAKKLSVDEQTVSRYCVGKRIPDPDIMRRIAELTAGAVMANDFYELTNDGAVA